MDQILYYVCIPLGALMKWCWQLIGNYGWAIVLFTLATKLVLLPSPFGSTRIRFKW